MNTPKIHSTKDTDIAFRDPLSVETRKVRRQLLLVAALTILVKTYELKLSKTPWLEFAIPANAPQVLDGALSVVLCYLLFVFILYGWQDFRLWRVATGLHLVNSSFDLILHSRNDIFVISQHLDKLTCDTPLQENIRTAIEVAAKRIPETQAKIKSLSSSLHRLNWLQWFRVLSVETIFPIVLGSFSLYKVSPALIPFLRAAWK